MRGIRGAPTFLVGLTLVAFGAVLGLGAAATRPPPGLQAPRVAATFPVTRAVFDDARTVELTPRLAPGFELAVGRGGVITATSCGSGETWRSGEAVVGINGDPLVALATSTPLYRSLRVGDRGEDVEGVQRTLSDLGFETRVDGYFGSATLIAWNRLRGSLGAHVRDALDLADAMWIPQQRIDIDRCDAVIGGRVSTGQTIASTSPRLVEVSVSGRPQGLLPGDRVLVLEGRRVRVPASGSITRTRDLERLLATEAVRLAVRTADLETPAPLSGDYVLADPRPTISVPMSAVVGSEEPCVVRPDGAAVRVAVIASSLGRSIVTPDTTSWPTDVMTAPSEVSCNS